MTERQYRFFLGALLFVVLYFESPEGIYAYIGLLMFEGITGIRLTVLTGGASRIKSASGGWCFEAERGMRIFFGGLMATMLFLPMETFWFLNWLIAFALLISGAVNYCPIVALMKLVGLR